MRRQKSSDRKSTRLNSSHDQISYAVFCLKKKKKNIIEETYCASLFVSTQPCIARVTWPYTDPPAVYSCCLSVLLLSSLFFFFFFNDTAPPEIYPLSLPDALPIWDAARSASAMPGAWRSIAASVASRSEEHTSELQSRSDLVCRLLLEKKQYN